MKTIGGFGAKHGRDALTEHYVPPKKKTDRERFDALRAAYPIGAMGPAWTRITAGSCRVYLLSPGGERSAVRIRADRPMRRQKKGMPMKDQEYGADYHRAKREKAGRVSVRVEVRPNRYEWRTVVLRDDGWRYLSHPTDALREGPPVAADDIHRITFIPTEEEIAASLADEARAKEMMCRERLADGVIWK